MRRTTRHEAGSETPPPPPEKLQTSGAFEATTDYTHNAETEEEASVIIDLTAIRGAMKEEVVLVRKSTNEYEVLPKSQADELQKKWNEDTPKTNTPRVSKEDLLNF